MKTKQELPKGWDVDRAQRVAEHYETQTEDQAVAEDEADGQVTMEIPTELIPEVRRLLAKRRA
jgi:hypothetical protein